MELRSFSNFSTVKEVIQLLREQKMVVLNLNLMSAKEAERVVDCVAGGAYALDGHTAHLGEQSFLFAPSWMKVSPPLSSPAETNSGEESQAVENS